MSKHGPIYSRTSHRLREIERIVKHRYGVVQDTDDADIILDQVACCILHLVWKKTRRLAKPADLIDRLKLWCERWAPDLSIMLCRNVAQEALRRPRLDNADQCAERLRLSYAERTRLHITTIGSYDVSKRERTQRYKARKRAKDRERAARKRAERGAVPRSEFERNSLSAIQPLKAQGISRRTWERRRRVALKPPIEVMATTFDASPPPTSTAPMLGDTPATPIALRVGCTDAHFLAHPFYPTIRDESQSTMVHVAAQRAAHACPRDHAGDNVERSRTDGARY